MNEKHDGGPAFPRRGTARANFTGHPDWAIEFAGGMSLRDYFAAKAMAALLVGHGGVCRNDAEEKLADRFYEAVSTSAYELADAMLKERAK